GVFNGQCAGNPIGENGVMGVGISAKLDFAVINLNSSCCAAEPYYVEPSNGARRADADVAVSSDHKHRGAALIPGVEGSIVGICPGTDNQTTRGSGCPA